MNWCKKESYCQKVHLPLRYPSQVNYIIQGVPVNMLPNRKRCTVQYSTVQKRFFFHLLSKNFCRFDIIRALFCAKFEDHIRYYIVLLDFNFLNTNQSLNRFGDFSFQMFLVNFLVNL